MHGTGNAGSFAHYKFVTYLLTYLHTVSWTRCKIDTSLQTRTMDDLSCCGGPSAQISGRAGERLERVELA